jgi:hypothetical protein
MHMRRLMISRNNPDLKTTFPNNGRHLRTINLTTLDFKRLGAYLLCLGDLKAPS